MMRTTHETSCSGVTIQVVTIVNPSMIFGAIQFSLRVSVLEDEAGEHRHISAIFRNERHFV